MEDKISIIVPVYNLESYIKRTVNSILAQTYQNIEVVIVDDGSKDNSWSEIEKLATTDSRIIPVHQENGGVTSARLNGVSRASGEWIGFVDGDDEIEPDMYELLMSNARKYHADISHCGYQMIFEDGRVHYFHNTGCLVQQDRSAGLKDLLDGSLVEPGLWNKLFHKSLFQSLLHDGVMPMDIKINEDLLMNFLLFSQSQLSVFEDRCKYHYIVRGTSASRQPINEYKIYDPIRVKEIILKIAEDNVRKSAQRAYIQTCIYTYCGLLQNKYQKDRKCIRAKIREHKDWCSYLSKRTYLLANLILYTPFLFAITYSIYERVFQNKKYD